MISQKPINVHINVFEGPMDLLLHLIKKDNLDVADVNVSEITKQYLEYLNVMKELNLEIAGEFLVMASTLMQIKAKSLSIYGMLQGSAESEEVIVAKGARVTGDIMHTSIAVEPGALIEGRCVHMQKSEPAKTIPMPTKTKASA